jgi:hypothetical protein
MISFVIPSTRYTRGLGFYASTTAFIILVADHISKTKITPPNSFWLTLSGMWVGRFENGARASLHGWINGRWDHRLYGVRRVPAS